MATTGSAEVLGRNDIGSLEVGKAADLFMINVNRLEYAGGLQDPASFPAVVGVNRPVDLTMVNGKVVYKDGILTGIDEEKFIFEANKIASRMYGSELYARECKKLKEKYEARKNL